MIRLGPAKSIQRHLEPLATALWDLEHCMPAPILIYFLWSETYNAFNFKESLFFENTFEFEETQWLLKLHFISFPIVVTFLHQPTLQPQQ